MFHSHLLQFFPLVISWTFRLVRVLFFLFMIMIAIATPRSAVLTGSKSGLQLFCWLCQAQAIPTRDGLFV